MDHSMFLSLDYFIDLLFVLKNYSMANMRLCRYFRKIKYLLFLTKDLSSKKKTIVVGFYHLVQQTVQLKT